MALPGFDKTIFVGGLHRSGTSLLARMLAEHPLIGGLSDTGAPEDEGQHVQREMLPASAFGGPGKFAFDPNARLSHDDVRLRGRDTIQESLVSSWAPHRSDTKPHFVEKSPPNMVRFRFLEAVFDNPYCILVVRHPVAVSQATQFWANTSISRLLEHWCVAHEIVRSDEADLERFLVVRYEDLVLHPTATLESVTAFLGVAPHTTSETVRPDTNVRYFRRFRHHRILPAPVKIAPLRRRYESRLQRLGFGYSLSDRGDR